jgi:hypothetical protein
MADSNIHTLALQDILLSIAEGLNKAQNELNNMQPYDEYGRPNTIYHVPYLDFNLQVVTEFENTTAQAQGAAGVDPMTPIKPLPLIKGAAKKSAKALAAAAPAFTAATAFTQPRSFLRFTPVHVVAPVNSATKNTAKIESSISGRFVAVVPNEGLPQIFIISETTTPVISTGVYKFSIKVQVKNASNEIMANTRVEFNFDAVTSNSLSTVPIANRPVFSKNEGLTDSEGRVSVDIALNATDYNNGSTFCFVINTSNIQKTISVSK